jgi:uncharacterized cupredoxin-like copper-binding protein
LLAVALVGAGCVMPVQAQVHEITVRAGDNFFEAPAQVQAGLVSITFENVGQTAHHMNIFALKEGVTPEQVQEAFPRSANEWTPEIMAGIFPLLQEAVGGPGAIPPGGRQRVTVRLAPGNYMLLCVLPDHEGVLHLAKGMMASMTVIGEEPVDQAEPAADATVKLLDFSFVLPQEIKAGEQTWKIVNEGQQLHELYLLKLDEGKTPEDVIAYFRAPQGTPPFEESGGFQGINPGRSGWLHLNLEPGDYVAICPIPDAASVMPHHELGMIQSFTVQ